jgi:hypothetical protein
MPSSTINNRTNNHSQQSTHASQGVRHWGID